jgi:Dynamin family
MFRYVRRILAASGFGGASQASLASGSDVRIGVAANETGEHQPGRLMAGMEELEELIAGSRGPMPRLVLCGEFSAGKSSIVNLLLGCDILPTAVLPSTRRPTYLRYAPDLRIEAILENGEREPVSPEAIRSAAREDVGRFEIGMPSALLRYIEVLDTPGFADPFHDPTRTLDVIESADICVWCTLATQAWRQSERQTWLSLPAKFRTSGLLVVTHVDTLANAGEHQRVRARLQREAGELFGDIVFLAVPDAMRARRDDGQIVDPELWRTSGGSALVATLQKLAIDRLKASGETESVSSGQAVNTMRVSSGPASGDPAASTAATSTSAVSTVGAVRTMAASQTRDDLSDPSARAEPETFLAKLAETVPACLAAAWIDLDGREVLVFHGYEPAVTADTGPVGDAITELFQGTNVKRIESLFRRSRGLAGDQTLGFQEVVIITDDCLGIFLRSESRTDRALVIISDKSANLGMVIARARRVLKSADLMV